MRRLAVLVVSMVTTVVALAGCTGGAGDATDTKRFSLYPISERAQAPVLSGDLLSGGAFAPESLRGQVVVLNFWASWCAGCRVEADDLEETYQATKASGVTFLGVNTRDARGKAEAFLTGRATYPSLFDPAGKVALAFDVPPTSLPATIVIDRQGRVAALFRVALLRTELEPLVTELAAEEPSRG